MITLSVDDQQDITELMKKILTRIDPGGIHLTASNSEQTLRILEEYEVQIIFLDIELSGDNGIMIADAIKERYRNINIVFVTGHSEYSLEAFGVHPSGFLTKPVTEKDIIRELEHLRFPLKTAKSLLTVQCSPFALFLDKEPFEFGRDRTIELFAYLVYRQGAFCSNGELLGILWDGNPNKQGHLRQFVLDMKKSLADIGAEYVIKKKYGKLSIDIEALHIEGDPDMINEEFLWL